MPTRTQEKTGARGNGKRKIRYAVVGLGYISQIAILPAFAHAEENSELTALVSGDPQKLEKLARQYGVAHTYSYEQYADCLHSGVVDAVYIALPNNMHSAYTVAAAEAHIHVLCEKPMAVDESECHAMIAAAEDAGVKLMIAYRLHFEKGNLNAIELMQSGKIGEPRIFSSIFSQQVKDGNSRLKAELGGGPLFDMGIYCINAARYLFGAEPLEGFAWSLRATDKRFEEVPEMVAALLKFPQDRLAKFVCSFGAADRSEYEVVGTQGSLKMDPGYELAEDLEAKIKVGDRTTEKTFEKRDQFAPEIVYFSDCILHNKDPEPSGREGLADVRIINALRESAENGRPVPIPAVEIERRPDMSQEMTKPAIDKPPQLVKAAAPGAN